MALLVYAVSPDGSEDALELSVMADVGALTGAIQKQKGLAGEPALVFEGQQLKSTDTLADIGVCMHSKVHWTVAGMTWRHGTIEHQETKQLELMNDGKTIQETGRAYPRRENQAYPAALGSRPCKHFKLTIDSTHLDYGQGTVWVGFQAELKAWKRQGKPWEFNTESYEEVATCLNLHKPELAGTMKDEVSYDPDKPRCPDHDGSVITMKVYDVCYREGNRWFAKYTIDDKHGKREAKMQLKSGAGDVENWWPWIQFTYGNRSKLTMEALDEDDEA